MTGRRAAGAPRRRRRRAQRAALPVDGRRDRACPCSPGPPRRRRSATCSSRRSRSASSARSTRRARSSARSFPPDALRAGDADAVGRGAASASTDLAGAARAHEEARRVSEAVTDVLGPIAAPADRWDGDGRGRADRRRRARLPLEPARRRPRARQPGRRQHVGEGRSRRPRRPRDADAVGQGLRHRPRDDRGRRLRRRSGSTTCSRSASATRWTTRRWSPTSRRCALAPDQPRPSIETLLHAFVPARARRPHASRRRDRAHVHARRARGSPRRRSATRPSGSTTSGPASTCRSGSRELLEEHPARARRPARQARPRHLGRDERGVATARRSSSSTRAAEALERPGDGRLRARRPEGAGRLDDDEAERAARRGAARAARRAARRRGRRDPRGRPQPRGGRLRAPRCARPR